MDVLSEDQAATLARLCEAVVPGSQAVSPVLYLDSVASAWPAEQRGVLLAVLDELADPAAAGPAALAEVQFSPGFQLVRALAIEAYYSDFRPPGHTGPTAWDEIDFNSPLARRLDKDWSFLGCYR
jgi:hypothetical protein